LETLYGDRLLRLVLFGSQARGDAEPDSDIDVLAVLRGAVNPSEEGRRTDSLLAALCLRHEIVVTPIFVSEERYREEMSPLLLNAKREGVPV
jgi:uncharacterized protein